MAPKTKKTEYYEVVNLRLEPQKRILRIFLKISVFFVQNDAYLSKGNRGVFLNGLLSSLRRLKTE